MTVYVLCSQSSTGGLWVYSSRKIAEINRKRLFAGGDPAVIFESEVDSVQVPDYVAMNAAIKHAKRVQHGGAV
mgnify:CR=1 FL=1